MAILHNAREFMFKFDSNNVYFLKEKSYKAQLIISASQHLVVML